VAGHTFGALHSLEGRYTARWVLIRVNVTLAGPERGAALDHDKDLEIGYLFTASAGGGKQIRGKKGEKKEYEASKIFVFCLRVGFVSHWGCTRTATNGAADTI
jgi:hypothetical protein